jgi:hypothetical protein
MKIRTAWIVFDLVVLFVCGAVALVLTGRDLPAHEIEFEMTQVTDADLALLPDGSLVFNLLGHLFRLPADGGSATQLTFGRFYDCEPAVSPDGARIAFASDGSGSERDIFVLELSSMRIRQMTHENYADRPVWTPDGRSITYISAGGRPQSRTSCPWSSGM